MFSYELKSDIAVKIVINDKNNYSIIFLARLCTKQNIKDLSVLVH